MNQFPLPIGFDRQTKGQSGNIIKHTDASNQSPKILLFFFICFRNFLINLTIIFAPPLGWPEFLDRAG